MLRVLSTARIMLVILADHLFQRIEEHKHSAIGNACVTPTIRGTKIFRNNLPFLRNVVGNMNVYEMLFIQERNLS